MAIDEIPGEGEVVLYLWHHIIFTYMWISPGSKTRHSSPPANPFPLPHKGPQIFANATLDWYVFAEPITDHRVFAQ